MAKNLINQIMDDVNAHEKRVDRWSKPENTSYYPVYDVELIDGVAYYKTLIRIKRDGKWYRVLLLKAIEEKFIKEHRHNQWQGEFLYAFFQEAYRIQQLYILMGHEYLEENQIEERERLLEYEKKIFKMI